MDDPTLTVLQVVDTNWDGGPQGLADKPELQTGWYDRSQKLPAVTFTNKDETPLGGGNTPYYGTDGRTGKGMIRYSGYVLVDAVAGTRDDCEGVGTNGEDLNPKQVRQSLYDHVAGILIDAQRSGELFDLGPGAGNDIVDTDGGPASFRTQFRAQYLRDRVPTATA
jgi:hypothetical protein